PRIVSNAKQLSQRAIATIDLRHFKRPLRVISHLKPVCRIEQERDRRVRRAATGVLLGKAQKLVSDTAERIQLKRILAGTGFEKLIVTLFEIDCRRARHVIEEVALPIPRKRRPHRLAITRSVEVIWPGKVLRFRKRGGGIAEVWRVIVKKRAAAL